MSKRKSKRVLTFAIVVVLILVIIGLAVSLFASKRPDVDFTLTYNNQSLSPDSAFYIDRGNAYTIKISVTDYEVKVVPNYETDILSFTVSNVPRTIKDLPDLTKYFVVEKNADSFVVNLTKTLPDIIIDIYDGYYVANVSQFSDYGTSILNLVVTSSSGAELVIPLLVDNVRLIINYDNLVF